MTTVVDPTDHIRSERVAIGPGAFALGVGGALSLVVHVLYELGHGPTVVNEHGDVLGLSNDTWSRVGVAWMVLVALGLVAVRRRVGGRAMTIAVAVVIGGLVLRSLANWVFVLYSVGELLLVAGRVLLAVALVRTDRVGRWAAVPLVAVVAGWIAVAVRPESFDDRVIALSGVTAQGSDLLAAGSAVAWIVLGLALVRPPADSMSGDQLRSSTRTAAMASQSRTNDSSSRSPLVRSARS